MPAVLPIGISEYISFPEKIWMAALSGKADKLTALGEYYWDLVN